MRATGPLGAARGEIRVFPDGHAVARAGAESFVHAARVAVRERGRFTAALSGGSTPREMYALLAGDDFAARVPWPEVHLFWGDERCVPPGHPRSNFRMAWDALLCRVPIPAENVHRMRGELPPPQGAREYAAELRAFFGAATPRFDLLHLGLGADGHTASLFPFDYELLRERARWVGATVMRELGEPRLSLTLPVLDAAAAVEVLVVGRGKAEVARSAIEGALDPFRLPAHFLRPRDGRLVWLLSAEAAARLAGRQVL